MAHPSALGCWFVLGCCALAAGCAGPSPWSDNKSVAATAARKAESPWESFTAEERPTPKLTWRSFLPRGPAEPASAEQLAARAREAETAGQPDEAARHYQAILRNDPSHALAHHRLGGLALRQGDYIAAESHLTAALRTAPPTIELFNDLGETYAHLDRPAEAEDAFTQALRLDPSNARATASLARVLASQERTEESVALLNRGRANGIARTIASSPPTAATSTAAPVAVSLEIAAPRPAAAMVVDPRPQQAEPASAVARAAGDSAGDSSQAILYVADERAHEVGTAPPATLDQLTEFAPEP